MDGCMIQVKYQITQWNQRSKSAIHCMTHCVYALRYALRRTASVNNNRELQAMTHRVFTAKNGRDIMHDLLRPPPTEPAAPAAIRARP